MKISEVLRYYPFIVFNRISKNTLYKKLIARKENETNNNIIKFQIEKEKNIKLYAIEKTNFYNSNPYFPIITKDDVQSNIDDFISFDYLKGNLYKITTSGSYGTPSIFYRNKQKKINQIADVLYFGRENYYFFGVKHAFIRGVRKSKKSLLIQNELHLSPNKLGQKDMERYYTQIKKVSHIVGFPSVVLNFVKFCEDFNLKKLTNIRGITLTAEPLTVQQRDKIAEFFNCPVLTRYASEEIGIIANRYPNESFYRINENSIKLEVYKIDKDEIQEEGKEGRIIISDFYSHAMPLINYDTGDLGVIKTVNINGENKKVLEAITGRLVEQLFDSHDEKISPFAINVFLKDFEMLGQFQFIQHDRAEYELLITNQVDEEYRIKLQKGLYKILGDDSNIIVSYINEIPSLSSGKRPYIINHYSKE